MTGERGLQNGFPRPHAGGGEAKSIPGRAIHRKTSVSMYLRNCFPLLALCSAGAEVVTGKLLRSVVGRKVIVAEEIKGYAFVKNVTLKRLSC